MKQWLANLREKFRRFMIGRYGVDELSRFMNIVGIVFLVLGIIPGIRVVFYPLALIVIILNLLRTISRDFIKRQKERQKYLQYKAKFMCEKKLITDMWKDRKTYRYYRCPKCKSVMRIRYPGFNHKITVTCAKCKNRFDRRTF